MTTRTMTVTDWLSEAAAIINSEGPMSATQFDRLRTCIENATRDLNMRRCEARSALEEM